MAGNRILTIVGNVRQWLAANQTSAGAGDAGKIVALNSAGQVDITMMPSGIGPTAVTATASASIPAGLVNLYNNAGALAARPADNTSVGSEANAFTSTAVTSGASASFNLTGLLTGLSGLTVGTQYFLGTVGQPTATLPTTAGNVIQYVGKAVSTSSIEFQPEAAAALA